VIYRWMEGALNAPDGKRPHPPRATNRRDNAQAGVRETLAGMKGWRPPATQRLETGSGSFQADVFLPDIGSIGLSFPLLGSRAHGDPWTARFPDVRAIRLAAAESDKWRPSVSQRRESAIEMAPALHLLQETGGPRNEDEKERQTRSEQAAPTLPVAAFKAESAHKRKKAVGVGVTR
jgi:hypothetical protein